MFCCLFFIQYGDIIFNAVLLLLNLMCSVQFMLVRDHCQRFIFCGIVWYRNLWNFYILYGFLTHLSTYVIRFLVSGSQGHWKTSRSLWRLFPLLVLNMWGCRLQFINIFLVIIKLNMFRWLQLCKWREKHIFTWAMGSFGFLLVSPNKLQIILTKVRCLCVVCCFVCAMFLFV